MVTLAVGALLVWWLQARDQTSPDTVAETVSTQLPVAQETSEAQAIATPPESPAPVIPDQPNLSRTSPPPFRSSPQQRAVDRERLANTVDLTEILDDLERRARAGDFDAHMLLRRIRSDCGQFAGRFGIEGPDPDRLERNLAHLDPDERELVMSSARIDMARCGSLAQPEEITPQWREEARLFRQQLASFSDALSRFQNSVPLPLQETPAGIAQRERQRIAGAEILRDGDPMDLVRHARGMQSLSRFSEAGYLLAACQLLPSCAGDPDAFILAAARGTTIANDLAAFAQLRDLSPRQRRIALGQSAEIVSHWRNQRFAEMLSPKPRNARGGGR